MNTNETKSTPKGSKGLTSVFEEAGRLKVSLPRQYFGGKQVRKALGLSATAENWAKAERIARRITEDLQDGRFKEGRFEEILSEYGIKTNLVLVPKTDKAPPLPKLDLLDVWERYLEYVKPSVKESTFVNTFKSTYTSALVQCVNAVGDDPIAVRNWLLANRCIDNVRMILSYLSKGYERMIDQGLVASDPFGSMSKDLKKQKKNQKVNIYDERENDSNLYDSEYVKKKAFTTKEVELILAEVKKSGSSHYYPILSFLFLTGCRTSEGSSFMWGDVKWDKEYIVIQRSYSRCVKKFVTTKTNCIRLFPMPKNSDLWILLKSIQPLEHPNPNQLVFPNKKGQVIDKASLGYFWRGRDLNAERGYSYEGLLTKLVAEGKVSKYLPVYNTRHTFISYQINECGVPPHVVKDWCGHSENMTTNVYRQEDLLTKPVSYDSKPILNQPSEPSENEVLKQQVQLLMEQNKMLQEIIVSLETKSKESNAKPIS